MGVVSLFQTNKLKYDVEEYSVFLFLSVSSIYALKERLLSPLLSSPLNHRPHQMTIHLSPYTHASLSPQP